MPKVTIAIPTFNRVVFLQQALDSALAQTYANIEIIVSNNASTDSTEKMLSTYSDERLKIIHQASNIGMMGNWDACLASASGEFFLLLSDDDVLEKNAIFELVSGFCIETNKNEHHPASPLINDDIGMVWCSTKIINENNELLRYSHKAPEMEDVFSAICGFFSNERETFPCSILLRTSDIRQVGGYAGCQLTLIADAHVWIACCLLRGRVRHVNAYLSSYRVHTDSGTTNAKIEDWLYNNSELARFCAEHYQSVGEYKRAAVINRLIKLFNKRVGIFLITEQVRKSKLASYQAFTQYFLLCKKFHIAGYSWGGILGALRVITGVGWFGKLRGKLKKLML